MKRPLLYLFAIVLLGTALRIHGIASKSLWYDEAITVRTLEFSLPDLLTRKADRRSVHPPLFFVVLRPWVAIWGRSEIALRMLSTLFGIGLIVATYGFVRELTLFVPHGFPLHNSHSPAICASFLVATSPLQIITSQQVRGYAMCTLLLMVSALCLMRALRAQATAWHWWLIATSTAIAACYTHNIAVFSVAAEILFAAHYLISDNNATRASYIPGFVSFGLFFFVYAIPWAPNLVSQAHTVAHSKYFNRPLYFADIAPNINRAWFATWAEVPTGPTIASWVAFSILLILCVILFVRHPWRYSLLVLLGLLPVLAIIAYSSVSARSIVQARYFTFCQPMWLCVWACFIGDIRNRRIKHPLTGMTVLMAAVLYWHSYRAVGVHAQPGIRAATRYLSNHKTQHAVVIADSHQVFYGTAYYSRNAFKTYLYATDDISSLRGGENLLPSDIITKLAASHIRASTVWIVKIDRRGRRGFKPPPHWIRQTTHRFEQDYFWEGTIVITSYHVPEKQ